MRSLAELYNQNEGKVSDKWELYLREYDRLLSPYRERSISSLEIGIQNGGSLEIWSQFFANAKKLVGCDINQACGDLVFSDPRISVVTGDACGEQTKNEITKRSKSFDLIIDDGSHKSADIVKTFLMYFPLLRKGGLFIVEDLHCSYWQDYEGGIFYPYSSMNFFKILADIINHEHWGISKTPTSLISGFEKKYNIAADDLIFSEIHSIEFLNSLCVIKKETKLSNKLGKRVVIGKHDDVVQGLLALSGKMNKATDQSLNAWTAIENSPSEQYESLNQAVTERDGEIQSLNQAVTERDGEIQSLNQAVTERDGEIQSLNQAVTERDGEIQSLNQAVTERDGEIQSLNQAVTERDGEIRQSNRTINEIYSSTSWRLSASIRWIGKFLKNDKQMQLNKNNSPLPKQTTTDSIAREPILFLRHEKFEPSAEVFARHMAQEISQLSTKTKPIKNLLKSTIGVMQLLATIGVMQLLALKNAVRKTKRPKNEFNPAKNTSKEQYDYIYTAIFGKYDTFFEPSDCVLQKCRKFIIFTDQKIRCNNKKISVFNIETKEPKYANRFLKINSHLIFPSGTTHMYIDGNILLYSRPPFFLEGNADMAIHPHPDRNNVLAEIVHTVRVKKLKLSELFHLFSYIHKISLSKHHLFEANIIYRRETETVRKINEKWWQLFKRYPYRDQFLLHGAIKHHKLGVRIIPYSLSSTRTSQYSITIKHRNIT